MAQQIHITKATPESTELATSFSLLQLEIRAQQTEKKMWNMKAEAKNKWGEKSYIKNERMELQKIIRNSAPMSTDTN